MRRVFLFIIAFFAVFAAGAAEFRVCTGLAPVAGLAAKIGGPHVKVALILPEGRSPHDYAPGPRELREASRCPLFLTTGMVHEKRFAKALPRRTVVCDVTQGIRRIPQEEEEHHGHHEAPGHHGEHKGHGKAHHHHGEEGLDPHVWLSPLNAARIAENIGHTLARYDRVHADFYRKNAEKTARGFLRQHEDLKRRLGPFRGRAFFVYHPAFGYFADAYGLHQKAIELDGREASPARMKAVIQSARRAGVRTIFVQKQFNPASGHALGRAIGGKVVELDPLAGNLEVNFNRLADALQQGFSSK